MIGVRLPETKNTLSISDNTDVKLNGSFKYNNTLHPGKSS